MSRGWENMNECEESECNNIYYEQAIMWIKNNKNNIIYYYTGIKYCYINNKHDNENVLILHIQIFENLN